MGIGKLPHNLVITHVPTFEEFGIQLFFRNHIFTLIIIRIYIEVMPLVNKQEREFMNTSLTSSGEIDNFF